MRFAKYSFLYLFLFSCVDEPEKMVVHTGFVNEINEQGALFTGSIQGPATSSITEYGFVWGLNVPKAQTSYYRITGTTEGEFQQLIQSELTAEKEYFVRAYASVGSTTSYGEIVTFTAKGAIGPVISGFSPTVGSSGTIVTIDGNNFSFNPSSNKVTIGSITCTVQSSTASQLKVQLPPNITTSGLFKVKVEVGGIAFQSTEDFTLTGPVMTNVTPISAIQGTVITISGFGFAATQAGNVVKFGQAVATVLTASPTQLTVTVPPTNFAGNVALTVLVNGVMGQYPQPFTIEGPEFFSITPTTAYPGKIVTITGKNFSAVKTENTVLFASHAALVVEATTTELKVEVPAGATSATGVSSGPDGTFYFLNPIDVSIKVTEKIAKKTEIFTPLTPWSHKREFPGKERKAATAFSIGQTGYVGAGTYSPNCSCYMNDFWAYNPQNDSWTRIADLTGPKRGYAIGFSLNNKGYVGGGYAMVNSFPEPVSDLWEYDPAANTWTKKNDLPASLHSENAKALNVNGVIYLFLGAVIFRYEPVLDKWDQLAFYPGTIGQFPIRLIAFTANGKIYGSLDELEFYEYDPASDIWTRKADIPVAGSSWKRESFATSGMGHVGGGLNYVDYLKKVQFSRYDPNLDRWTSVANTLTDLFHTAYFEIDGLGYFVAGGDQQVTKKVIKFNPIY